MDQAIKAALDKYHGKNTQNNGRNKHKEPMGIISVLLICITLIIVLAVCVKNDFLGAGKVWEKIGNIDIGKTTISQMISTFKERFEGAFQIKESKTTDPVNSSGESGSVQASTLITDGIIADYLSYDNKFISATPVQGRVTSAYGERIHPITGKSSYHHGIDVAAELGTDIVSYQDGVVSECGFNEIYGNYIIISHGVYQSFYGHLDQTCVSNKQNVSVGEIIGKVGSTGKSTGPHLHFELRCFGQTVDPSTVFDC